MKDFWNERYRQEAYAYGTLPNAYFKTQLEKLPVGKLLLPAEGEGRNAVFAATLGWDVTAFDISIEGKNKALQLAQSHQVHIQYEVGNLESLNYDTGSFDAIALIYAHFPADVKSLYHKQLSQYVRQGGMLILEGFSKQHLAHQAQNSNVGGPKDIDMLFSKGELSKDFHDWEMLELVEQEIELQEGLFHNGKGFVVRCLARKQF